MSNIAYVGIGTNLGNRLANFRKAVEQIGELRETRVTRESSLYESEPHGRARNWFLNAVIEVQTELDAKELLKGLQKIEAAMGRKRTTKKSSNVSRSIDLDILLFNSETISSRTLTVPHPEMANRRFVLLPLSELVPAFKHPVLGETVSTLLVTTEDRAKVTFFRP